MKHYRYGGSTAARLIQCPAWLKLADKMPKRDGGSDDATRGTALHECMERLLHDPDLNPQSFVNQVVEGYEITLDDVRDAVIPALNAYLEFADEVEIEIELPEVEVKYAEEIGGTSDVICLNATTVFVTDWKFGYHAVDAHENKQGLFYAMCARKDPKTAKLFEGKTHVAVVIVQPQADTILNEWRVPIERLDEFEAIYNSAIKIQDESNPVAGDACKFCPAMALCPIKTQAARKALMIDPKSNQAEELKEALELATELESWVREVFKLAHEQAELGMKIDGWKLVNKRAIRKWDGETGVIRKIKNSRSVKFEECVDMKLKSPAQIEKIFKEKNLDFAKYAAYIKSESSGTTLAPESDKRPAVMSLHGMAAAINANDN